MHFEIYKDKAGEWRWTLYAVNGRKIADSGEGYNNKADCQGGIELVRTSGAPVIRDRAANQAFSIFKPKGM